MAPRRSRSSEVDPIEVKFGRLGQAMQTVTLEAGSTAADLRDSAGIEDNVALKRQGTILEDDDVLEDGDRILLNPKRVTGGSL